MFKNTTLKNEDLLLFKSIDRPYVFLKKMVKSYKNLRTELRSLLSKNAVESAFNYFNKQDLVFWGEQQGPRFREMTFLATLFKDTSGYGYEKVLKEIKNNYPVSKKSLQHNVEITRKILAEWSEKEEIKLGDLDQWRKAAKNLGARNEFKRVTLWMDSTDMKRFRPKGVGKKLV